MAHEYPPMDISHDPDLLKLAEEVRKTKKARTVTVAEGVIAVVKPERTGDRRRPKRRAQPAQTSQTPTKAYTLESAYGAVADAGGPRDFDQMIREAKEDALSIATMEQSGLTEIVSYDRDFDRVPGITRREP